MDCHTGDRNPDAPQVTDWEHPVPIFDQDTARWSPLGVMPLFDADGREVPPGDSGALACATCHWTHGPEAAVDSLRRRGWQASCASCHGDDALPLYRYFHQPDRRKGVITRPAWLDPEAPPEDSK